MVCEQRRSGKGFHRVPYLPSGRLFSRISPRRLGRRMEYVADWQVLALTVLCIQPMLMLGAFVMGLAVAEWLYGRAKQGG